MPASRERLRVARSTVATRNKTTSRKSLSQRPRNKAENSPKWVSGHPDLFKIADSLSPRKTRRSSIYQKVASPSRYRNAKIPASNCRKNRGNQGSSNSLPTRPGVVTRSRRASSIYANHPSLLITVLSPRPEEMVMDEQPPKTRSQKSVKSNNPSKVSLESKESRETQQVSLFCPETFVAPHNDQFVLPDFPEEGEYSTEYSNEGASSQAETEDQMSKTLSKVSVRSEGYPGTRSSSRCKTRSAAASAVSIASAGLPVWNGFQQPSNDSQAIQSTESIKVEESKISSLQMDGKSSRSLVSNNSGTAGFQPSQSLVCNKSATSLSPNTSDFVMIPCGSDTEISFNVSRHDTARTPLQQEIIPEENDENVVPQNNPSQSNNMFLADYLCEPSTSKSYQRTSRSQSRKSIANPQSKGKLIQASSSKRVNQLLKDASPPRHAVNVHQQTSPPKSSHNVATPESRHEVGTPGSRRDVRTPRSRNDIRTPRSTHCVSSTPSSQEDVSTPPGGHKLRTPRSKRFLESMAESPVPVTTRSFYPPPQKMLKLSLPAVAASDKALSGGSECSRPSITDNLFDLKSPSVQNSSRQLSQHDLNATPVTSNREVTLRDISNSPSRLDTTQAMETYQTPMAHNRTCVESETFYETPRMVCQDDEQLDSLQISNLEVSDKLNNSMSTNPAPSSNRCIIL